MSLSRRMSFISPASPASPPPCTTSSYINMYVIRAGVTTGVDAQTPDQLRMFELDDLHGQTYHPAVDRGDFTVAVGVDRDVGGVAVLVLAVTRRALNSPVVLGGAKAGMHVDVDVGNRLVAVPAGDLLDPQL